MLAYEDFPAEEIAAMRAAGVALVVALLGRSAQRRHELDVVQQRIGRLQAEHLAAAGHTRLGYAYPDDKRLRIFAEPRLDGVRPACTDLGLDAPVVRTVPLDPDAAARAVRSWRERAQPVTGVCAYNDDVAMAVLAGLSGLGLAAPADLAVVGVDDIPAARLTTPALTTVTTDMTAVAAHLAAAVVAAITGQPEPTPPGPDIVDVIRRASA